MISTNPDLAAVQRQMAEMQKQLEDCEHGLKEMQQYPLVPQEQKVQETFLRVQEEAKGEPISLSTTVGIFIGAEVGVLCHCSLPLILLFSTLGGSTPRIASKASQVVSFFWKKKNTSPLPDQPTFLEKFFATLPKRDLTKREEALKFLNVPQDRANDYELIKKNYEKAVERLKPKEEKASLPLKKLMKNLLDNYHIAYKTLIAGGTDASTH